MKNHINFPEIGLVSFFLLVSGWYLIDAYEASSSTENLLLILPVATVVIVLCLWILSRVFFQTPRKKTKTKTEEHSKIEKKKVSVLGAMIILAAFILSMNWVGFDLATFVFLAALMFLQGERRPIWLVGFSLVYAILVSLFFEIMIPYPMPMLLGKEFFEGLL